MKEVDIYLNRWIRNPLIREEFRNIIIKAINKNEKINI